MKKTKFHRLLAFALALCFLIGGMFTVTVAADAGVKSKEDDTLAQIREELNAVSYEEYKSMYFKDENGVPRAESSITILGQDYDVDATTGDVTVKTDANTGEVLSYNAETKKLQLYNPTTGSRRDAQKSEVAPGVWINADFYVSMTGDLLALNTETGDAGTVQAETSKFIASVYANGKELNYA